MGRGLNMSQIKEIWGNGADVIIKFKKERCCAIW
jgi:hypothetical protein